ncbi:hypothetical protein EJ110_NYTH47192 [Nymphaea thermarum]|nr:hypothetical protein EJ110_NYTH47192 [Nymphaea thermarum]
MHNNPREGRRPHQQDSASSSSSWKEPKGRLTQQSTNTSTDTGGELAPGDSFGLSHGGLLPSEQQGCCLSAAWRKRRRLGGPLTPAEILWFRCSATTPDFLIYSYIALLSFCVLFLCPLPLALIEAVSPGIIHKFTIQLNVSTPFTVRRVARVVAVLVALRRFKLETLNLVITVTLCTTKRSLLARLAPKAKVFATLTNPDAGRKSVLSDGDNTMNNNYS